MPKPVKKRRPASDRNLSAADIVQRSLDAHEAPPPVKNFKDELSAYMSALGSKGGKIGGKRRLVTMTQEERSAVGLKAAKTRWKKAKAAKRG